MSNGRFRKKEDNYTKIGNAAIVDKNISLKALGLYTRITYYLYIPNFDLYKNYLLRNYKEGEDAFESAWKELKKLGYLAVHKVKDEKGKICWEYELLDEPSIPPKTTPMETHRMDKPPNGKTGVYNKTLSTKTLNNNTFKKDAPPSYKNFEQRDNQYNDNELFANLKN